MSEMAKAKSLLDEVERREAAELAARALSPCPDYGGAEDEAAGGDTEMPDTTASASAGGPCFNQVSCLYLIRAARRTCV